MAIFRCKMCGGDLEIQEGSSVATCEYCGRQQTVPTVRDENLQGLFNRANVLRMKSEFDKAEAIYERILQNDEKEAEAYWGLILCKYGIEYVEDPQSGQRIPTCHRTSYDAITADEDYKNAIQYADSVQREIYESEAKAIDEIQKGILSISMKEEPYDVFICYKESDDDGKRTIDSTIANDIYYQLTQEGFKVFYAAITLEDKLGQEYEPYIFSALNTAKVMISLGTKPEFFNAVWVKNEWSRYLKIMKKDRSKLLIPCYRDMDAYELPEEFAHLQAQDMSKIGFINDLIRGIRKVIGNENGNTASAPQPASSKIETPSQSTISSNTEALLKRGNIALEDAEWDKADGFFEEVLNQDAECAEAYLGKWLAKVRQTDLSLAFHAIVKKYDTNEKETIVRKPDEEERAKTSEHIREMKEKYQVSGYLSADQIRERYEFYYMERKYDSSLSFRQKQKEAVEQEINGEKLLVRARQYATGKTKEMLEQVWKETEEQLDQKVKRAEVEDNKHIREIDRWRAENLKKADQRVQEWYSDAMKKQEEKYQSLVKQMNDAAKLEEESRLKVYENLSVKFSGMYSYKDTMALAEQCKKLYQELWDLIQKGEEEEREKRRKSLFVERQKYKKKRKIAICMICIAVGIIIFVIVPHSCYRWAVSQADSGDYEKAESIFKKLGQFRFKDSKQKYKETILENVRNNKYVSFGTDNDSGKKIQWKVLDRQDDRILLLSENILFNDEFGSNSWESCEIREWLNTSFWKETFNDVERSCIISYTTTETGADKVLLLNEEETKKYLTNEERKHYDSWWLRDYYSENDKTSYVTKSGLIVSGTAHSGDDPDSYFGILPAIWISTTS